ncbi:MAG: C40 family peptidase [Desulfococcaceae bacterium]
MAHFSFFRKILPFFLIIWITGCGSALRYPKGPDFPLPEEDYDPADEMEDYLWKGLKDWQGVPYKWGGENRSGVDCSGFTKTVYRKLFNIRLPRTSAEQSSVGKAVKQKHLRAGDLVFFSYEKNANHVGIYLGKRKFIHASQKKGVMVSHMDKPYWKRIYRTSRRVLKGIPGRLKASVRKKIPESAENRNAFSLHFCILSESF